MQRAPAAPRHRRRSPPPTADSACAVSRSRLTFLPISRAVAPPSRRTARLITLRRRQAAILPTASRDGATVARIRTLDPQSLTRHVDRLYRAAWGLCGSREDAEDLVQDTFARVLARPRKLHGDDELAYLMKVLRNTFLTSRRTASRRPQTGVQLEEGIAADERASAQPEHALEVNELYAAVAELS
ncbi:MAG TPA: sigma factor, partial [Solirubrobacteraceae bacterium]|nr:sigma factor [Solirubrobacteraceae bacterium]